MSILTVFEESVASNFLKLNRDMPGLLHAAVGAAGEAGELLDATKKAWVYGKYDRDHMIEELGDMSWYLAAARSLFGVTRERCATLAKPSFRKLSVVADIHEAAVLGAGKLLYSTAGLLEWVSEEVEKGREYVPPTATFLITNGIGRIYNNLDAFADLLGVSQAQYEEANMAKLKKRYPQNYTDEHAIARLDKTEVQPATTEAS